MNEISLKFIFDVLKKHLIKILAITIAVIFIAAAITHFLIPKKYTSTVKFYVYNINTQVDYTSTGLLEASTHLINDYIEIIMSDPFMDIVCEELDKSGVEGIEPAHIRAMLSHKVESDQTAAFSLSATHTNKSLAYAITKMIADIGPAEVTKIAKPVNNASTSIYSLVEDMDLVNEDGQTPTKEEIEEFLIDRGLMAGTQVPCLKVLHFPQEATTHSSPSFTKNVFISGVIALIFSFIIFFIISMLKNTVNTEDDVREQISKPLIGTICSTNYKS